MLHLTADKKVLQKSYLLKDLKIKLLIGNLYIEKRVLDAVIFKPTCYLSFFFSLKSHFLFVYRILEKLQ